MHSERAQLPLSKLAEVDMAFASWSLWCRHEDSDQPIAPAWTNGKTIFYGKDYERFTFEEKIGVAAHELTHVAFRHVARGAELYKRLGNLYNHKAFNIAIDAITNEMLRAAGKKLPSGAIFLVDVLEKFLDTKTTAAEALTEWDSEKLYMALLRKKLNESQKDANGQNKPKNQGQKGQQNPNGQPQGGQKGQQDPNGQPQGGQQPGDPQQGNQPSDGYEPTAIDAIEEWAKGMGYEGDIDEQAVHEAAAQGEGESSVEEAEWAQRVARGLAMGKQAGSGIGTLGFKIADLPKTRTPWEHILRQLVTKAVTRQPRPSYMRPTKTFLAMDSHAMRTGIARPVYEQGWVMQKGVPKVVVGVDVSGSIDDRTVSVFASEIASIGKRTGAEIHVLVFDTQVLSRTKMQGVDWDTEITKVEFARGGGTDFKPVIAEAKEMDPSIIVILTDLYADFGPDPECKVVWAVEEETSIVPPFGRVITMER